jgi:outer membrane protein
MNNRTTWQWVLGLIGAAALGAIIGGVGLAGAQAAPAFKIGIVDVDKVAQNSKDGKAKLASLENESKAKQAELEKEKAELDRLKKDFDDKAAVWSEDTKKQKANDLDLKSRSLQRKYLDYQDQIRKRAQEVLDPLEKSLTAAIEKLGIEQKYSMIIDLHGQLIYYDKKIEITDEITRSYDAKPEVKPGAKP